MAMDEAERLVLERTVEQVLDRQVRPILKIHGGGVTLERVEDSGEVLLEFEGACRGCSLKSVTYALGVRQKLMPVAGVTSVTMRGVRLSDAALDRVEKFYGGHTPWVGVRPSVPGSPGGRSPDGRNGK